MYKLSLQLFRVYWSFIFLMSALLFLLDIWANDSPFRKLVPAVLIHGYLVYIFHLTLLKGPPIKLFGKNSLALSPDRHFWIAFVSMSVVAIFLAFGFFSIVSSSLVSFDVPGNAATGLAFLLSVACLGVLFSVLGTMIPAATIGSAVGFAAALKRARRSFWYILWRLITGPTLSSLGIFVLWIILLQQGLFPPFPETFSDVTVFNAVSDISLRFFGTFSTALVAAIFSMAYLQVEEGRAPEILR